MAMNDRSGPPRPSSRRRSLAPLWHLATILVLVLGGCDSSTPTAPDAPETPTPRAVDTIAISPPSLSLAIGGSQALTITVTPAESVTVGISTNLGNFGVDSGGNPTQVVSVPVATDGTGRVTFFAGDTAGNANIVANLGTQLTTLRASITPEPGLFLTGLSPSIGSPDGGDMVTIDGQGFSTDPARPMQVSFDGAPATVQSSTATKIKVTTPPTKEPLAAGATLNVDVLVSVAADATNTAMSNTLPGAFTYTRDATSGGPVVLSVTPSSGTNRGGETVGINGSGFATPVQVAFGQGNSPDDFNGVDAEVLSVDTAASVQQIVVVTPPATSALLSQTVDVLVRNLRTGGVTLARSIFTYQGEMVVSDIQPREAPYTADLSAVGPITVTGTGFDDIQFLSVEFGGVQQTGGSVNNQRTQITFDRIQPVTVSSCMPPSGPAIVTNLGTGAIAQSSSTFAYTVEEPRVVAVSPSEGAATGETTLTLSGTFSATEITNSQVRVDGQSGSSIMADSGAGALTFVTPPFTGTFDTVSCMNGTGTMPVARQVDIVVTYLNTGCSATLNGAFSYLPTDMSCTVPDNLPQPSFTFGADPGGDPLTVAFTNTTSDTSGVTFEWFFGDGSSSNIADPGAHTYADAGVFTIILRATNGAGTGSFSQSITVPLPGTVPDPPRASFTFSVVDNTAFFTNTTTPLTDVTWEWFFGDGTTDDQENPEHTYAAPGSFTVTLRATNAGGTDSFSQQVTIAEPSPPVASFAVAIRGLTVELTSTSSGNPTSFTWQLGDGTTNSTGPSIEHTYAVAGTFDVTLQATNAAGTGSTTQTVTVQ